MLTLKDIDNYYFKLDKLEDHVKNVPLARDYAASMMMARYIPEESDANDDNAITCWFKPEDLVKIINEITEILGADTIAEIQYQLMSNE